jgi:tetratricopeptide (TPR) repeat protein
MARPFVSDNYELTALGGMVAWDKGRLAEGEEAVRLFDEAIAAGPHRWFHLHRSDEHYGLHNYDKALEDANAGLLLSPEDPALLENQFLSLLRLRRAREARQSLELLAAVDPTHKSIEKWRDDIEKLGTHSASSGWRDAYDRGYQLHKAGDDDGALAAFQESARLDPSNFQSYQSIDILLVKRRDFPTIIRHWDIYLQRQPLDGRGYLERAGAHYHNQNAAAARADMLKACELKTEAACNLASGFGWR